MGLFSFHHYWVFFYSVLGIFLSSGFPSPLLFLFVWFADFGSYVLGGDFVGGVGDLSIGSLPWTWALVS